MHRKTTCRISVEQSVTDCYNDNKEQGIFFEFQENNDYCTQNDQLGIIDLAKGVICEGKYINTIMKSIDF